MMPACSPSRHQCAAGGRPTRGPARTRWLTKSARRPAVGWVRTRSPVTAAPRTACPRRAVRHLAPACRALVVAETHGTLLANWPGVRGGGRSPQREVPRVAAARSDPAGSRADGRRRAGRVPPPTAGRAAPRRVRRAVRGRRFRRALPRAGPAGAATVEGSTGCASTRGSPAVRSPLPACPASPASRREGRLRQRCRHDFSDAARDARLPRRGRHSGGGTAWRSIPLDGVRSVPNGSKRPTTRGVIGPFTSPRCRLPPGMASWSTRRRYAR